MSLRTVHGPRVGTVGGQIGSPVQSDGGAWSMPSACGATYAVGHASMSTSRPVALPPRERIEFAQDTEELSAAFSLLAEAAQETECAGPWSDRATDVAVCECVPLVE
jgi:hypothetical protein